MRKSLLAVLLACMIAFSGAARAESLLVITFLGQQDGGMTLLQCDGETMLMDAGVPGDAGTLLARLLQLGVTSFDHVISLPSQQMENGALGELFKVFDAGSLWIKDDLPEELSACGRKIRHLAGRRGIPARAPAKGDAFQLGGAEVSFLFPEGEESGEAFAVLVRHGGKRFIFAEAIAPASLSALAATESSEPLALLSVSNTQASEGMLAEHIVMNGNTPPGQACAENSALCIFSENVLSFLSDTVGVRIQRIKKTPAN